MASRTQSINTASFNITELKGTLSSRRAFWMAGFGLFSVALIALGPNVGVSLGLVMMLSVACSLVAERSLEAESLKHTAGSTVGSMLAASIHWFSMLISHRLLEAVEVEASGLGLVAVIVIGFITYCLLTLFESLVNFGIQCFADDHGEAAAKIAHQIDVKFAGFFGEINR